MRFTNFYAAQATCTASRAGILTGCYPNRIHMYGAFGPWTIDALNPKEETIAGLLKKVGYNTCMVGKWGMGSLPPFTPTQYKFDHYLGLLYSNDMWPVNFDGTPITDTGNGRYRYPLAVIRRRQCGEIYTNVKRPGTADTAVHEVCR